LDSQVRIKGILYLTPLSFYRIILPLPYRSSMKGKAVRKEVRDFVDLFWPNLAHWSCMLWDPQGFPTMLYEMNKYESATAKEAIPALPGGMRLAFKAFLSLQSRGLFWPRSLGKVRDRKRMLWSPPFKSAETERSGIVEYLEDASKTDEHTFRNLRKLRLRRIREDRCFHGFPYPCHVRRFLRDGGEPWEGVERR
jgi:hypothetical protein